MGNAYPLVSVVMPVFNGEHFLQIALESVRSQDYPSLEIVVVDDGSTDRTQGVLACFSNSWPGCMKVLTHSGNQNCGITASYQLGLENCQGKYIAFLEHDDFWPKNKISEQIIVFEALPEVGVVFSDVYTCDEQGRVADKAFKTLINKPPTERPFNALRRLLWGNFVSTFSNTMVRQDRIDRSDILANPEGFQDWMLLMILSSRCKFYHCSRTRTIWRQRQDSYFGKLRQLPKYTSRYRRLRELALRNAIAKILAKTRSHHSSKNHIARLSNIYWTSVISLLSGAERMAAFLNRKVSPHELS